MANHYTNRGVKQPDPLQDCGTRDYFDSNTPHFKPARLAFAVDYLKAAATPTQKLIDVGCGDGSTLAFIKKDTCLKNLTGMDVSEKYLEQASQLTGCDTIKASILDSQTIADHSESFDYCVLSAVLHHLIGKNRAESFRRVKDCIKNAATLLKPGGKLLIFEPTHGPAFLMDVVFWIKKFGSLFTDRRIELSRRWINFGQPIVSYYTPKELLSFIEDTPDIMLSEEHIVGRKRLGLVILRIDSGLIIEKKTIK